MSLLVLAFGAASCTPDEQPEQKKEEPQKPKKSIYDWSSMADKAQEQLEKNFWGGDSYNFYFTHSDGKDKTFNHYWNHAHILESLMDAYERTGNDFYRQRCATVRDRIKKKWPEYHNNYYDDMAWMGIAFVRAYKLFGDDEYLNGAKSIYEDCLSGWDERTYPIYNGSATLTGGMRWRKSPEDEIKHNACTNWTIATFYGRLYLLTKDAEVLKSFDKIFDWCASYLQYSKDGYCCTRGTVETKNPGFFITYEEGVMIGAYMAKYQIEGKKKYLDIAVNTADFCLYPNNSMMDSSLRNQGIYVWRNEGEDNNNGLFKGILCHYLLDLIRMEDVADNIRVEYIQFMENCAYYLNDTSHNYGYLCSYSWTDPDCYVASIPLAAHQSGVILFEVMSVLEKDYINFLKLVK